MMEKILLINNSTVQKYLSLDTVIECVEKTYQWYAEGKVIMPPKITLDMEPMKVPGWINSMPSYIHPRGLAGIKWVGGFVNNHKIGLPYIKAKIMLTDPETGMMKALLDGDWISDIRTGAQAAIFAKYLACKDSGVVTVIGAGTQGYTALMCLCRLMEFKEIRICDINLESCGKFISRVKKTVTVPISMFSNNREAVQGADIIVTATTADAPLVDESLVKPGVFVAKLGSYQELDEKLVFNADKLIVDHITQSVHRGELVKLFSAGRIKESDIYGEFPDIAVGRLAGRENDSERIVSCIVGMGCLDVSIAALLYEIVSRNKDICLPAFDIAG